MDELVHTALEKVLPQLERHEGLNGVPALANRGSGKVLTVVLLWEGEEAMRASEQASYWYRRYSAEAAGDTGTSVERYEVVLSEMEEALP